MSADPAEDLQNCISKVGTSTVHKNGFVHMMSNQTSPHTPSLDPSSQPIPAWNHLHGCSGPSGAKGSAPPKYFPKCWDFH